jgi:hypothetical protein
VQDKAQKHQCMAHASSESLAISKRALEAAICTGQAMDRTSEGGWPAGETGGARARSQQWIGSRGRRCVHVAGKTE